MKISKEDFQLQRTPSELREYVNRAYEHIMRNPELVRPARLKKEPYKTFSEELLPFSAFCSWKYGDRTDVLCSLLPGTPAGDAVVKDRASGTRHLVEITWPMDGQKKVEEGRQLNERGMTVTKVWDYDDVAPHLEAVQRALSGGRKKSLKDYRMEGGSTLILVFDEYPYFWEDDPKHQAMLDLLVQGLRAIEFKVANVVVLLVPSKRIIEVKSTEHGPVADCLHTSCSGNR